MYFGRITCIGMWEGSCMVTSERFIHLMYARGGGGRRSRRRRTRTRARTTTKEKTKTNKDKQGQRRQLQKHCFPPPDRQAFSFKRAASASASHDIRRSLPRITSGIWYFAKKRRSLLVLMWNPPPIRTVFFLLGSCHPKSSDLKRSITLWSNWNNSAA